MIQDNLLTITNDLTSTHLELAFEKLYELREPGNKSKGAVSVILHSYFGLESTVNFIGYEMFFNKESQHYIKENERDMPLKKMLKSWNSTLQCIEKLEFITSYYKGEITMNLKNRLIELNNLRNWLSHGFSYKTTSLLQPQEGKENTYDVIDSEDEIDWNKKFPNCKFNSIVHLDINDAEKAIRIVLEILVYVSGLTNRYFFVTLTYCKKYSYRVIHKDTNIDELINTPKD